MPPKDKRPSYQERVAKRRRVAVDAAPSTSGAQASQQHPPAFRGNAPGTSGVGPLNPEILAAITAAVTQALKAVAPTTQVPQPGASEVQFVPDPTPPPSDSDRDRQLGTQSLQTVQNTVSQVIETVISPSEQPGSQSKNTFLSQAIPLSNRVSDKVKKQIWANEYVDFALLLNSSLNDTQLG